MTKPQNSASLLASVCGGLTTIIGLVVLFGWHTHNLQILHLNPAFVAMAYNTALGIFLCGTGLLALSLRRPRLAIIGGAYGVLCGVLTLGEYVLERDFHIDELFMRAYTTAGVTHNARMAFNSAFCLLMMGAFLLLHVREKNVSKTALWRPYVGALIGSLVLGLGVIALTGYTIGVQSYYTWGQFTRMALHTALGFVLFGTGVLAYLWQRGREEARSSPRWLPVPVGIGFFALAVSLWQALIVEQRLRVEWLRHLAGTVALPPSLLRMNDLVPRAALLLGIVLSLLLALLVALAQDNQQRALRLSSVNQELREQMRVRQEAQTALQRANDTLENRVGERTQEIETLNQHLRRAMTETHHRVKNNLQVISALIDMQCMDTEEFVPKREMERLRQHVRSLAGLHDLLTHQAKTDDLVAELNVRVMTQKLVPMLQEALPIQQIRCSFANVHLPVRPATSLMILINEMVSNAAKHGSGDIEIELRQDGDEARLTVRDHGPGFPLGFNPQKAAHTGLDLVQSLAQWDLRGAIAFENVEDGGGRVVVTFPLHMPPETG